MARPDCKTGMLSTSIELDNAEGRDTHPNQPVLGLELLLRGLIVIDQAKACAPSTTEGGPEPESDDTGLVGLVDLREPVGEVRLGDVRAVGVEDIDDELAACQEAIRDKLAGADRYGGCVVGLHVRCGEEVGGGT